MPTQFIAPVADGNSVAAIGALSVPKYLSLDAEGASQTNVAGIGARVVLRFLAAQGENAQTVRTIVGVPFAVRIDGAGDVTWLLDVPDRTAADVAFLAQGENAVIVPGLQLGLPPLQVVGVGDVAATFAPYLPPIAEPAWNELRGTINLLRNASVENADHVLNTSGQEVANTSGQAVIGTAPGITLLDWSGVNGAALEIDNSLAWHGTQSVRVAYPSSGSDARVTVRSEHGLGITGELNTAFVGSLWALGTITFVQARLTATYSDASTDTATGDLFDLAATADWVRVVTPSLTLDPAKTLDFLTLDLMHPTPDAVTVIHVDGAQIEQDRGESATPFAQGDMGAYYAWLGPEGLSMSLRETMAGAV